jgi:surface antigen
MYRKRKVLILVVIIITVVLIYTSLHNKREIGQKIDEYKSISVFYNGAKYSESYGKSYSSDGYYYGLKWQCVEYVKRFYYEVKGHKMPDGFGNAKDFFDPTVPQGKLNKTRGLIQYRNGSNVKPAIDDLIVFNDSTFGHVAIVIDVGPDYIEVIQQNKHATRQKFIIETRDGNHYVGIMRKPAGWLRKE